jgi:hypothetical protein
MKKFLLLTCALILAVACAPPATNQSTSTERTSEPSAPAPLTEAEAITKEKAVWDTLKRKDYDAFSNMLASDYIEVGNEGVYDKAGIVTHLKDLDITDVTFSDWRLIPVDKNMSLLLYNLNITGKFKGEPIPPGSYRASSGWANRDGKWQAIYYQETKVQTTPPPPPPSTSSPAATVASPSASAATTVPTDPVERERVVWDALKRRDYTTFASFLDESAIDVEPGGVYDKAGTRTMVQNFDASKGELSDFKTVKLTADAELVTYVLTIAGAKPEKERATSIWVNRGGTWKAVFHQGTPMSAPGASPSPTPLGK